MSTFISVIFLIFEFHPHLTILPIFFTAINTSTFLFRYPINILIFQVLSYAHFLGDLSKNLVLLFN